MAASLKLEDEPPSTKHDVEIINQDVSHDRDDVIRKNLWHFFDQQVAQASVKKLNKFGTNHANAAVLTYQQHRKKRRPFGVVEKELSLVPTYM